MLAAVLLRVLSGDDAAHAGSVRDGHCRRACILTAILPLVPCRAGAAVGAGYGKQEPETLLDCWMTGEHERILLHLFIDCSIVHSFFDPIKE